MQKITAGSGYEYLTRNVARLDGTHEARPSLASYYTEKGETPGRWVGTGLPGLDLLAEGDPVTAEQMWNLFAVGYHPLAEQMQDRAAANPDSTRAQIEAAARLGNPFKTYTEVSPFRTEVARRLNQINTQAGRRRDAALPPEVRARVRTEVATEMFLDEYHRPPHDARELAGHVAKLSRQQTTAVAGFDITFSPVKSVSTLWALAEPALAARIEQAHNQAVADALRTIETTALYTRLCAGGVRQVDVRGLVGAAFTHRDSRAGDPDLHTHVAIANKVQTVTDGRWLAIDGRVLLKAIVTISETYNTALERHLTETIGVRFAARSRADGRRPVREIVGVDPALNQRWSTRRQRIESRRAELATAFQQGHGRPPSPVEAIALAQQATLETRDAKHEPRSLPEQRATWHAEARQVLGSEEAIAAMVQAAVGHQTGPGLRPDEAWITATARTVIATVEGSRSTWQRWHVQAEALRRIRDAGVPSTLIEPTLDQVVDAALTRLSMPLARPNDGIAEPRILRRADGTSQYTVAGAALYTSSRVLAAEQALVAAAGRHDGFTISPAHVAVALAESAANGTTLNPGQTALVEAMATSGARVQAAIAPAGSGKTTAMRALTQAWTDGGGTVLGLAPSAAAAAQLRDQTGATTETLAKLVWNLEHHTPDPAFDRIDPTTLVIIDEAGMADTITLHTVVQHALERGASVRLIGDDQQLAAIGAGGVLRDIEATHGVLRLDELVRFQDPAEAAASLALRQGRPEALGFYLDQQRVHVGDLATMTDDVFNDWLHDQEHGRDALMLAPTRDLVADLNQRARTHRLAGQHPGIEVTLADGNTASAGDTIITRVNNRQLRTSSTDFVKNGDRWRILATHPDHGLHVQHTRTHRTVHLPASYVAESVELGYASTIHTAQGISVDVTRGVLTGAESRQLLYTMMTRGRHANHAYLTVVADGNEHSTLAPETLNPLTPTDMLEGVLARDDTPASATTQARLTADPRARLADAANRYADAVSVAAHNTADPDLERHLTRRADDLLPGLTTCDAWPTLLNQLVLINADGRDPIQVLHTVGGISLHAAHDPAAVLAARLDLTNGRRRGPLPWLPGIPDELAHHPQWGPYLTARRALVSELADQVRDHTLTATMSPVWVSEGTWTPSTATVCDVEVWRAATGVDPADLRPTGERQHTAASLRHQKKLDRRLHEDRSPALAEWGPLLRQLAPTISTDPYLPQLARRLAHLSSQGVAVRTLLTQAVDVGALPDDHPAGALWYRLSRDLDHTQRAAPDHDPARWLPDLNARLGEHADAYTASPWWPNLLDAVERGLQRGWTLDALLDHPHQSCEQLLDHVAHLAGAHEPDPTEPEATDRPDDLWDGYQPTDPILIATPGEEPQPPAAVDEPASAADLAGAWDDNDLTLEALIRQSLPALEPTPADLQLMFAHADQWRDSPVTQARLEQVNTLASDFYASCLQRPGGWPRAYLAGRFGIDVAGHPDIRPGYAPHGWTTLVNHLRTLGVTDTEMLTAGVATRTRDGRLIDRFRDRIVLPILHNQAVLGFVGRRHPQRTDDDKAGPKYLNTPETPLFPQGHQLYGTSSLLADPHRVPVLVEGPFDAHAVTLASNGHHVGLAPLGTSLTPTQAAQLAGYERTPIVATDADAAGRLAAERDYWLLTPHGLDPRVAHLPAGTDPAQLVGQQQAHVLLHALRTARPLADLLTHERVTNLAAARAAVEAVSVLAAQPPHRWEPGVQDLARRLDLPAGYLRSALKQHVRAWNTDPRRAADQHLGRLGDVKARLTPARQVVDTSPPPTNRYERIPASTPRNRSVRR